MPINKHKCDAIVFQTLLSKGMDWHQNCSKSRSSYMRGLDLNRSLQTFVFLNDKQYKICNNMQRGLTDRLKSSKTLSTIRNPILQYVEPSKRPIDAVSSIEHIQSVKKRSTTESVLKEFASHLTYYKSYKSLSPRQKL